MQKLGLGLFLKIEITYKDSNLQKVTLVQISFTDSKVQGLNVQKIGQPLQIQITSRDSNVLGYLQKLHITDTFRDSNL